MTTHLWQIYDAQNHVLLIKPMANSPSFCLFSGNNSCTLKRFILCLLCLYSMVALAQQPFSQSTTHSALHYIYKVTDEEALKIYRQGSKEADAFWPGEKYLHTLAATYADKQPFPTNLPPGNYVAVYAVNNNLEYTFHPIKNVNIKLVANQQELAILVHDIQGNPLPNARVTIRNRNIPWDEHTRTYSIPHAKRSGIVKVYYNNVLNIFDIKKPQKGYKTTWWKKIFSRHKKYKPNGDFYRYLVSENQYKGFMAFSKAKYKPNDTVRLKAFIVTNNGKPVNEPLLLRLSDRSSDRDTILTTITPYRPGGYTAEFVLNDTLDLELDQDYLLTLEPLSCRKYMLKNNNTGLDDDEFAAKRTVLLRGKFHYEEYELKSVHFTTRTDHKEHTPGMPVALYLKATDENDLPVMDGRVIITVTPQYVDQYYRSTVFIPNTLWEHEVTLEATGETKVMLPDSIFPAADMSYTIKSDFRNSNNESQYSSCSQSYQYNTGQISFTLTGDSLSVTYNRSGISQNKPARLLLLNNSEDTVAVSPITLPAMIPVHPFVTTYRVTTDSISKSFSIQNGKGNVQCNTARTRDSVFATISNPGKLYFWYSIFAGKKLVAKGYEQQLSWKAATTTRQHYFVAIQYIWHDDVISDRFVIPYMDKQLQVAINNPIAVFPGQTARIGITVTDATGQPVKDADVTAYAMTTKFEDADMPLVPYLGKKYPVRKMYNTRRLSGGKITSYQLEMTWERWKKEMTLDSIEYYRFLHPDGIYYNREPAKNNITQLAPFVVTKGVLRNTADIKIDEQPVYFDHADLQPAFSFAVNPGWHRLELRISRHKIIVDSVYVVKGMKNYISIASDATGKNIQIIPMPLNLTKAEMLTRRRYLLPFRVKANSDFTYINQGGKILWFNNTGNYGNTTLLAGPLKNAPADYNVKGSFTQGFVPEAGNLFQIQQGLIKQKELPSSTFRPFVRSEWLHPRLYDHVITESEMDSLWDDYQDAQSISRNLLTEKSENVPTGDLVIAPDTSSHLQDIRQLFLYRYDDPSFINIYTKDTRRLRNLEPGQYRLLVLLSKKKYYVNDSLTVREHGHTFYQLQSRKLLPKDSTSIALGKAIFQWKAYRSSTLAEFVAPDFTKPFNDRFLDTSALTGNINGVVLDESGRPLPGVSVVLKGTNHGVVTNINGRFSLTATGRGFLSVMYIGYETETLSLKDRDYFEIKLKPASQHLDEVVVTGYGISKQKQAFASYSFSFQDSARDVMIRGTGTLSGNQRPLIIIDGIPFEGDSIDPQLIKSVTMLKGAAATALYGEKGAGGVLLATSTKAAALSAEAMPSGSNNLRSHFRDDAFWQPRLRTNEKGEAAFNVTFPDDITSWKTFAIAFTDQGQTGSTGTQIKSFVPLSANLALPVFAVAGDSINIIGKILNYGKDSTTVSRSFYNDQQPVQTNSVGVVTSRIDTFPIRVPAHDSVSFKYTINGPNNYFDGEYRAIPVFEQGVKETNGMFAALSADTSFTLSLSADTGTVHLYASTGILPVLLDEIDYLQRYEYRCNEQLASKLMGLLLEKKAYQYLGQPFKNSQKISGIIRELEQNKNKEGGWGWWNKSATVLWVTQHVTTAMLLAEKEGFAIHLNKPMLTSYYLFELNAADNTDKLSLLEILQQLEAKVNFRSYLDTLQVARTNRYDQFRLLYLKQHSGITVSTDSLLALRQTTMMGNSYWGMDSYHFFNNSVQLTLLAYKILRTKGGEDRLLHNIRSWFMENRRSGNWRNTYESAAILATIMPDVLQASEQLPATLRINGQSISSFPYSSTIAAGTPLQISKEGGANIYFTAWQQHWNPAPQKASNQFAVSSRFLQQDTAVSRLTAGSAVTMEVVVDVKADADYVMVEIPIPAGCSYENKNSARQPNEIHREYFKNKVSIFSNHLHKGIHTFIVSLMPRYTGNYHLNPAKAEMMYFPVFYGREEMKKVVVGGK
jgi:alpha-2-macroglobulin